MKIAPRNKAVLGRPQGVYKMPRMTRAFAAALVFFSSADAALAFMAGNAVEGGKIAAEHCVACHSLQGRGAASPESGAPDLPTIAADTETYTLQRIIDTIAKPHGDGKTIKLSSRDTDNLVAFILSLRED